jgi:DNA topoisomerase-3
VALIEGFARMRFETSLGKPFLRKEMELKMKAICEGRTTKQVVLRESLEGYRRVYEQSRAELGVLKAVGCLIFLFACCCFDVVVMVWLTESLEQACRQYVFQQGT